MSRTWMTWIIKTECTESVRLNVEFTTLFYSRFAFICHFLFFRIFYHLLNFVIEHDHMILNIFDDATLLDSILTNYQISGRVCLYENFAKLDEKRHPKRRIIKKSYRTAKLSFRPKEGSLVYQSLLLILHKYAQSSEVYEPALFSTSWGNVIDSNVPDFVFHLSP